MSNVPSSENPGRLKNLVFGLYFFAQDRKSVV